MLISIKFKKDENITKETIKVDDSFAAYHKSIYFQGVYKMTVLEVKGANVKMKSKLMFVEDGGEFFKLKGHYRKVINSKEVVVEGKIYKGRFTIHYEYSNDIYHLIPFHMLHQYII